MHYRDEDVDQLREQFYRLHERLERATQKAHEATQRAEDQGLPTTQANATWEVAFSAALAVKDLWRRFDQKYGAPQRGPYEWSPGRPTLRSVPGEGAK